IMQLQEKGLINVDDPLEKYIFDYPNGNKITLHHLLTHTAGIPNITDFPELQDIKTLKSPVEKTIELFKNKPLEFAPGEQYKYSNSGYILLGYIIEKVSGKSYEDYLQENIFNPLNMDDSGYDHHRPLLKNRAAGYCWGKDGIGNADYIDMSLPHAGGIEGFQAQISRFVDDDVCIIVLSNFEFAKVPEICKDLAAILFGEKYEIPAAQPVSKIDPSKIDDYVGTYEFEPDNILNVLKEDNRLLIAPPGQPLVEIFPVSKNKFLVKAFNAELTFVRNNKNKVSELIFHVGGQDMRAKKIK
ncbi:MAG: serine hydrolase, partial [Candidatus Atribacteria bacterium]|nr:serine hydrolase [Candidatus Atribacteria bacterium]